MSGILCTFDQLIVPLSGLRSGISNDAFAQIDHDLLVAAFRSNANEYVLPYMSLGISDEGSDEHYLFIRNAMPFGRHFRAYDVARFTMDAESGKHLSARIDFSSIGIRVNDHPLDKPSFKRNSHRLVSDHVQDALCRFLKSIKTNKMTAVATNAKKSSKRDAERAKKEAAAAKRTAKRANLKQDIYS